MPQRYIIKKNILMTIRNAPLWCHVFSKFLHDTGGPVRHWPTITLRWTVITSCNKKKQFFLSF